jgi:hypothetical protein
MGSVAKLLKRKPEAKEVSIAMDGETFTFRCDAPGEVVSDALLVKEGDLAESAQVFSRFEKRNVATDTVRLAKIIRGTLQSDPKPTEHELVQLFLGRPVEFLRMAKAAQSVLGIDITQLMDDNLSPDVAVGAGNLQGAVQPASDTSPESPKQPATTPTI